MVAQLVAPTRCIPKTKTKVTLALTINRCVSLGQVALVGEGVVHCRLRFNLSARLLGYHRTGAAGEEGRQGHAKAMRDKGLKYVCCFMIIYFLFRYGIAY